ncbi:hypothetical protein C7375_11712 [Frischella perrara]|uniref:Uncharacterized protein n=1 Tax=Frischella perrara TaxID=1267021 RepID=A0A0A7S0K1_FRIPE|nr:hypothetical protein [Frischella perrara]AJA44978.1 hypothetical protein FPB0191_01154 [Frischella perrara]PWV58645.1 hypothetical protein C7375_11712 [Frischella perrara]
MDILKKIISGKLSLAVMFWGYYFGFIIIATACMGITYGFGFNKPMLYCIFLVTTIIELLMIIAVTIGISRILKYQGVTFWGLAALIVCVLHCMGIIICFLDGSYSYNEFLDKHL